ncbi:MAG: response regulator [Steroidobacteraceae bacterium]|jgi:CheY-like chemotaxis protein
MQIGVESSRAVENKRVFVVDSDEITRAILQFMLHDENETHEISSIAQAYDKAADWRPDVILLGMPMVNQHGPGIINELRERIPGVRIAVIADSLNDAAARDCLKLGASSLLAKPLTIEAVRRKVDTLLGRRTSLAIAVQIA